MQCLLVYSSTFVHELWVFRHSYGLVLGTNRLGFTGVVAIFWNSSNFGSLAWFSLDPFVIGMNGNEWMLQESIFLILGWIFERKGKAPTLLNWSWSLFSFSFFPLVYSLKWRLCNVGHAFSYGNSCSRCQIWRILKMFQKWVLDQNEFTRKSSAWCWEFNSAFGPFYVFWSPFSSDLSSWNSNIQIAVFFLSNPFFGSYFPLKFHYNSQLFGLSSEEF